jgi:hypothetical protein
MAYFEYIMNKARKNAKYDFNTFCDFLYEDGMYDQLMAEDMGFDEDENKT